MKIVDKIKPLFDSCVEYIKNKLEHKTCDIIYFIEKRNDPMFPEIKYVLLAKHPFYNFYISLHGNSEQELVEKLHDYLKQYTQIRVARVSVR